MSTIKMLFIAAAGAAVISAAHPAFAGDSSDPSLEGRSLANFSVRTNMGSSPVGTGASPALRQVPSQAPDQGPTSIFSAKQAKLMQDLSKTIDVIPGGVRLCLNIHY